MESGNQITPFAAVWSRTVATHGSRPFLIFEGSDGSVQEWSYSEFDREVSRAAAFLQSHGVAPGLAVHLALSNSPWFVALWLATNRLGAWMVPSDPMGRTPELADHITRTKPKLGFCAKDRSKVYRAATENMEVVEVDERTITLPTLPANDLVDWPEVQACDLASVMFTSGTTGQPKGVEITQANYGFTGTTMAAAANLTDADRYLVVLPLFHANAQFYSFASAISVGASIALMHTFSASRFIEQAARHNVTCASLFAAPIRMILARGNRVNNLQLRHCWFAQNISEDQYDTFSDWIGCKPRQLYGMTETTAAVLTDDVKQPRADSMGGVTPGCTVDVQDDTGRSVSPGEVGEIVVSGERGVELFAGYLHDPETTRQSFRKGWFRTGDKAKRNETGRHFFQGRGSDILKVAGENVSTVEVETVLSSHPAVLEAAVVGVPDHVRDEVPIGYVVPVDSDKPPTIEELARWCEEHLSKFKRPKNFIILDELPRTSVGKIRKFLLKNKGKTKS